MKIKTQGHIIAQALKFIEINIKADIKANDIAQAAGTDPAYLRKIFNKKFNMPCMTYLRLIRLKAIRKHIQRNPYILIGDLATEYQFKNHGDMSRYYKDAFGELPKQTAKNYLGKVSPNAIRD